MKKKLITCRKCHGESCEDCNYTGKIKNPKLEENKPTIRIMSNGTLLLIKGELDSKWLSDEFDKLTKPYRCLLSG